MPTNNDQEYIGALQDFSKSLEYLIIAIQNQYEAQKTGKDKPNNTQKQDTSNLVDTAKQLSIISEDVTETKSNTVKIIEHLKGLKKQKETGFFAKLSSGKDKAKGIAEGIKTIALMAGSILAIGLAFKVIGDVDFKTVIALSIALPLLAIGFDKVAQLDLSPKEAMNTSIAIIAMSVGIAASGVILSTMPSIGLMQLISAVGVAFALGIAAYGLGQTVEHLNPKKIKAIYALIPLMPFMATGLVSSGYILATMPTITFTQFLSATGVAIAMGLAMAPLAIAAEILGNDQGKLLQTIALMPVLAGALVISSFILQNVAEVETLNVLEAAFAISTATLMMGASIGLVSKFGIGIKEIALGTLSMVIMSAGLVAMSHILSFGNWTNYPPVDWAKGVGLSMLVAVPTTMALGILITATAGFGYLIIAAGISGMLMMAAGLVAVGKILKGGTFEGGPSVEWASGVGLSLKYFAEALASFKPGVMDFIVGTSFDDNVQGVISIAKMMKQIPGLLGPTSLYVGTGPTKEWASGVGLSLKYFAEALSYFKQSAWDFITGTTFDDNVEGVKKLAEMMKEIPGLLGPSNIYENTGPNVDWAKGVGGTLVSMAKTVAILADEIDPSDVADWIKPLISLSSLIPILAIQMSGLKFDNYPSEDWSKGMFEFLNSFAEYEGSDGNNIKETSKSINMLSNSYFRLAKAIMSLGRSLKSIDKIPDLTNLYGGLVTLSLIDNDNLALVMDSISERDSDFIKIMTKLKSANAVNISTPNSIVSKSLTQSTGTKITNSNNQGQTTIKNGREVLVYNPVIRSNELLNKIYFILKNQYTSLKQIEDNTEGRSVAGITN